MNYDFLYPTISPFPSFDPNSPTDLQMVQILHQIQNHTLTINQALYSAFAFSIPGPISWKLALYNFFNLLPIPPLSPMQVTLIVVFGPFLSLIFFIITFLLLIRGIKALIPAVFRLFIKKQKQEHVFLELTFPCDTSKSAYATEQLYNLFHSLSRQQSLLERLANYKKTYSLELVATKEKGIRYIIVIPEKETDTFKRSILSYLPGIKIKDIPDYFTEHNKSIKDTDVYLSIEELTLSGHHALPLKKQKILTEHDHIMYLTGNMTKLKPGELISLQFITTPVLSSVHPDVINSIKNLMNRMYRGQPLSPALQNNFFTEFTSLPGISLIWFFIKVTWKIFAITVKLFFDLIFAILMANEKRPAYTMALPNPPVVPQEILNPYEQELQTIVKEKIDQNLFETSIRVLAITINREDLRSRVSGLMAAFGPMNSTYQAFRKKSTILPYNIVTNKRLLLYKNRNLSPNRKFNRNPILSTSEISDLYHFPHANTTKTEDMVKVYSKELPAPLSLKNNQDLDVVFGKNTYAGETTEIGLTDKDRAKHVYLIGRTGSGKSTILFHMASQDILEGRGLCVIDPHGDLAEDLLTIVPTERKNEFVYINPFDLKYPVGINLLELQTGLDEDDLELEKELVCENVIAIFRRVFTKDENTDAHRIEYILRNTIYTAFTVKDSTIFTVYNLLNDPKFQKEVVGKLEDENLINFWKNEYGIAGNYQVVKMVSGVTAKVGRFLFSPTAKRILEQPKSTINFDRVFEEGKLLICNLSEGKLSEDTSELIGTVIISKIHQAAIRRARIKAQDRRPFYLYVDEFQNFATKSFTKLLSGGRKFGLRVTIAQQSTAQHDNRNMVNVILANIANVICFQTASPIDEEMMWLQFAPTIEKGEIANLPQYRFYIKLSAITPEEPFSGETFPIELNPDQDTINELIEASRKNYAIKYIKPEPIKTIKNNKKKATGTKSEDKNENVGSLL